jgi:hypothetical protein
MILLSFTSSVKYILSLMLAVLGYLPAEEIASDKNNLQTKPSYNIECFVLLDSLNSHDSIFIHDDCIRAISMKEVKNISTLETEIFHLPDNESALFINKPSELKVAYRVDQVD